MPKKKSIYAPRSLSHEALGKISELSKRYDTDSRVVTTEAQLAELVRRIKQHKKVAFDTETKGLSATIVGISFGFSDVDGYYIPVGHEKMFTQLQLFSDIGTKYDASNQLPLRTVLAYLKPVFEDPEITFIGWNMGYDFRVMCGNGIRIANIEDAQIMGWLLDENKSTALKERSKIEKMQQSTLKMEEFCDESNIQLSAIDYVAPYAIQDACLTYQLFEKFSPELHNIGLFDYYQTVEVPFIFVLSDIMMKGMRIDLKKINEVKKYCAAKLEEISKEIFEEVGESFNISSPKQCAYVLYEKLGLPIYKRTPGGEPSCDKKVLALLSENGFSIVDKFLDYSTYNKLLTTYLDGYEKNADAFGRIHTSLNQTGTVSGRLCVAKDTLIETDKGTFEISKLDFSKNTDYYVRTHTGKTQRISLLVYKGVEGMYKVTLENGSAIKCTSNHRFLTKEGWKHLNDLSIGNKVLSYEAASKGGEDSCSKQRRFSKSLHRGKFDNKRGKGEVWDIPQCISQFSSLLQERIQPEIKGIAKSQKISFNASQQKGAAPPSWGIIEQGRATQSCRAGASNSGNSQEVGDNRVLYTEKYSILRSRGISRNAPLYEKCVRTIFSRPGAFFPRSCGTFEECNREPQRVLRKTLRDFYKTNGHGLYDKRYGRVPFQLQGQGPSRKKPYLLVYKPLRNRVFQASFAERYSTYSASLSVQELYVRFPIPSAQTSRGVGWGPSQEFESFYVNRPEERKEGQGTRLQNLKNIERNDNQKYRPGVRYSDELFECPIVSVEFVGEEEVWDIQVENDHSYLAQGFVNHNTSSSPNLQQIPRDKRIRELFIPDRGRKYVIADYSQLELRVLTHFSQDKVMVNAFTTGEDLHTSTACRIYEKTPDAVSKDERFLAKTVNFSIVYGSGAKPEIGITNEFIEKWRKAHYGAFSYIKLSHREYEKTGYSRTITGRYRRNPDLLKTTDFGLRSKMLRELFSAHIQGSAADVVKMAMIEIYSRIQDSGIDADIVIQVHDEIIVECDEKDCDEVSKIVQHCMETALPLKCPLEATPNVGNSWADKQ